MHLLSWRGRVAVGAACLCATVAVGCGSSDSDSKTDAAASGTASSTTAAAKPAKIAFFTAAKANTYSAAVLKGVEEEAEKTGATVQVFDPNFDAKKQFAQLQDAVTSKQFDGFVVVPLDGVGIVPALKQAIDAGIKVAGTSLPIGPSSTTTDPQIEGQSAAVLDPPSLRGKWIGDLTVKACAGIDPCKVAYLPASTATPAQNAMTKAFKDVIKTESSIDVVAEVVGGYTAAPSLTATQDILQSHKDINVITANGDQQIGGAERALKGAGVTAGTGPGQVRLIGLGGSDQAVAGIKKGTWFGSALSVPVTEGQLATEALIEAVNGTLATPLGVSAVEKGGFDAEATKATLGDFTAQWAG